MNKFSSEEKIKSIYFFDELENNRNFENVRKGMNRVKAMSFLHIGVTGSNDFSIHSQLNESDLRQLLEHVLKILPQSKAIVSLD